MTTQPTASSKCPKWTGFGGKTLWDMLDLAAKLAIPFILGIATIVLSAQQANLAQQQHDADQRRVLDQQQATTLQTYIDNIQDLLLNHNLLKSKSTDAVAILARARTLTALPALDPRRKGRLLIFLYDAKLIGFSDITTDRVSFSIIGLGNADFSNADLSNAYLGYADLTYTNLSHANLSNANFINADLTNADLTNADLSKAHLSKADLIRADLSNANLSSSSFSNAYLGYAHFIHTDLSNAYLGYADLIRANLSNADLSNANLIRVNLRYADLSYARNLTQQQLDQVSTCQGSLLPKGLTCHHNQ